MYCLHACISALFSPEILQAGAVRGLKSNYDNDYFDGVKLHPVVDCSNTVHRRVAFVSRGPCSANFSGAGKTDGG